MNIQYLIFLTCDHPKKESLVKTEGQLLPILVNIED